MLGRTDGSENVGDEGYRRIRDDIIFGHLLPEQKLRLPSLKEIYGLSISTLREVLARLSSEGFVIAEGKRGFEVALVSATNLRELAELRILLECHAMERSFTAANMEWEGRVVSAHHKLAAVEQRMIAGEPEVVLWKHYDGEFHRALISNCGSEELMDAHQLVFDRYFRYPVLSARRRGPEPIQEHHQLLECALARDADRAAKVLTTHLSKGVEFAITQGLCAGLRERASPTKKTRR
jgi:GntR family transcriptional regulator, carbon starvation induced regulator